ncbi:MAG: DUF1573 domain-containing protein [Acidobacteriia bacterium]|nr:DUF1573 domain-containing protein [Terriglobia bacterium]
MKKNLLLLIGVLSFFLVFFLAPVIRAGDNPLETQLRARVTEFWTAWSRGETEKVNLLVREGDRQAFANVRRYEIKEFKIESVQFGSDSKSAVVRTHITRTFPTSATPLVWTLENQWVYEKGDWYLQFAQNKQPAGQEGEGPSLFRSGPTPSQPPPPNDIVFDSTTYDFGAVTASASLQHVFSFENRGKRTLRLVRLASPCQGQLVTPSQCAGVVAHSDASFFAPGTKGKIEARWQNALTPQKVDQAVELYFSNGQSFSLRFVGTVTESKAPKP